MQGWTWASGTGSIFGEENLIPCFYCGFIPNSAAQARVFQLLGSICSFPLCSLSAPQDRGLQLTPHLLERLLQNTPHTARNQSPWENKESTRAGCGPDWGWAGVCSTLCFAPRATMQSEATFVNSIKFMTQEWYNPGNTSSWCEPHLSHGKFCY